METKKDLLILVKRLVPGTKDIEHCKNLEYCMEHKIRYCNIDYKGNYDSGEAGLDVLRKSLCIPCIGESIGENRIIGGISFIFNAYEGRTGLIIHRFGQAGNYATMVEGNGINEMIGKLENDDNIKEITEKTEFINKEYKDAKNLEIIEAFKRKINEVSDNPIILVTRKNEEGRYDELDEELIKIAKNKKEETGKDIRIVDTSELKTNVYLIGISSKKVVKKIDAEAEIINDSDCRLQIYVVPVNDSKGKYAGVLAIESIDDDLNENNDVKDKWKQYFTEKYTGLEFMQIWERKKGTEKDIIR